MGADVVAAGALGVVLVPLVSLLKREHWSEQVKFILSLIVSFVAALVIKVVGTGADTWQEVVALFGTAFTLSQVVYRTYFVNTGLNTTLTNVGS